jgi:L,D-peptidoglycan transpeptidase YkuD (ErfK/YbiS/YcfS/YnhG family)
VHLVRHHYRWGNTINPRRFAVAVVTLVTSVVLVGEAQPSLAASRPGQIITVQAASSGSRIAVLRTWRWASTHYMAVFSATVANVGIHGVGPTREGLGRTPIGVYTVTQAFGNQPSNGTRLPYFRAGIDDWWDESPTSAAYNRHVRDVASPGGDSENLYEAGAAYAHAVVINYNSHPVVKGAGSGFFLHVSTGYPTAGCVAINSRVLTEIMRWLRPDEHPVISIGVGSVATSVLRSG